MNLAEKLSPHFTFGEVTVTEVRSLQAVNRKAAEGYVGPLTCLCETLLEPVRAFYGRPLVVTSGYRCAALNAEIGGATSSQHMAGEAADFHVPGVPLEDVFAAIARSTLAWGQLIYECDSWIHLSLGAPYRAAERCMQVLRFDGKRYFPVGGDLQPR